MDGLMIVDIASTESAEGAYLVDVDTWIDQTDVPSMPPVVSHTIPPSIDRGQAIYWSYVWRAGEEETRKALAEGQGKTFPNAQEAIRWLLSNDA